VHYEVVVQALWLILPAYAANGCAVLVGGGLPIDFGKKWKDGRRILGDGKTWRGLFFGSLLGTIVGFSQAVAAKYLTENGLNIIGLDYFEGFPLMIPIVISIGMGALLGDIVESFFKRRIGKKRGEDWVLFDQLDFIVGALCLVFITSTFLHFLGFLPYNWFIKNFTPWHILVVLIVTPALHITANMIHKRFRQKSF